MVVKNGVGSINKLKQDEQTLETVKVFVDKFCSQDYKCKSEGYWKVLYFDRLIKEPTRFFEKVYAYLEMHEDVISTNKYLDNQRK